MTKTCIPVVFPAGVRMDGDDDPASLPLVIQQWGWDLEEILGLRVQRSVGHLGSTNFIILASSLSQALLISGGFKLAWFLVFIHLHMFNSTKEKETL